MLNLSLSVWPLVVAYLLRVDPTYTDVELFFVLSCVVGLVIAVVLYRLDYLYHHSTLERVHLEPKRSLSSKIDSKESADYLPLEEID